MSEERGGRRTLRVRVEGGASLLDALLERARAERIAFGRVSGFGVLRTAALTVPVAGGGRTEPRALEGPFEITSLSGLLGPDGALALGAQLARSTDAGLGGVGGRLVEAIVEDAEIWIDELDAPAETNDRAEDAPRPAAPSLGWAAVAEASESAEEAPATRSARAKGGSGAAPSRGEYIEHKVFGICRVESVKPDGTMVIRLETGRRKQLKLDALDVGAPKPGGGRVIYPVKVRRDRSS